MTTIMIISSKHGVRNNLVEYVAISDLYHSIGMERISLNNTTKLSTFLRRLATKFKNKTKTARGSLKVNRCGDTIKDLALWG